MLFRDAGHLFRLAGVFLAGILLFLVIRRFLVPKSFGEYGHYRGNALSEIAARPINFAGHDTCETCHADVLEKKKDGKHAHVNCEACHGAFGQACGRSGFGDARQTRYGCALRALP